MYTPFLNLACFFSKSGEKKTLNSKKYDQKNKNIKISFPKSKNHDNF